MRLRPIQPWVKRRLDRSKQILQGLHFNTTDGGETWQIVLDLFETILEIDFPTPLDGYFSTDTEQSARPMTADRPAICGVRDGTTLCCFLFS
ncbi:MAG: hypothetical protein ACLFSB_11675 [Chitinispirillaceae bacterium]